MSSASEVTVVILGRPNVGKSTLFNRLLGQRKALVHDEPGVTRDRIEGQTQWWHNRASYRVKLIDTGGLGGDRFAQEIRSQVDVALQEASMGFFVLDGSSGLTPADQELFRELKRQGVLDRIPVLGVVNKIDAEVHEDRVQEFYRLGFEELRSVSAEHGRGIDDLQSWVLSQLPEKVIEAEDSEDTEGAEQDVQDQDDGKIDFEIPRLAIVGKPNVGKSTLMNALLGEERVVVSPVAGTTVDSIDVQTELGGRPAVLMDTVGMRRKSKTEQGIEVLSVVQTRKALERANIALLMIDAETGPTDQDEKIAGLIEEVGCSVILAVNKWDLSDPAYSTDQAADRIRGQMRFLAYAPIVFISAKRKKGLAQLGDLAQEILQQRQTRISTHEFTEWVRKESEIHNPGNARFFLSHQAGRNPPTFVCHVSDPKKVHFSLSRHLVNAIRERWGFMGTPLRLLVMEAKGRQKSPSEKKSGGRRPKKAR